MELSIKTLHKLFGLLLVTILVNAVTTYKFGSMKELVIERPKSFVSVENVDRTLDCLAMNIYKEAKGESFEGKVAVAQVTLNRASNPSFPSDICKVIMQKSVIMDKVVCQFSWYCDGSAIHKPKDPAYTESYKVAKKVLLEGFRLDGLKDALYFHSVDVKPQWPHHRLMQIGNHIFYKSRTGA